MMNVVFLTLPSIARIAYWIAKSCCFRLKPMKVKPNGLRYVPNTNFPFSGTNETSFRWGGGGPEAVVMRILFLSVTLFSPGHTTERNTARLRS